MKILEEYELDGHEPWQKTKVRKTNKTEKRKIFTWLPLWIDGKFSWLQKIKIRERLYLISSEEFDDGLSYKNYWPEWEEEWIKEEILKVYKK